MKRIFVLGMLVMALSIVNINPSNAVLLRDESLDRLEPEDDFTCVCANALCDCLENCDDMHTDCVISTTICGASSSMCDVISLMCDNICHRAFEGNPEYTCYPQPTSYDIITDCTSRCIQKGGTRIDCLIDCGGY